MALFVNPPLLSASLWQKRTKQTLLLQRVSMSKVQRWKSVYAAARHFGGFVTDSKVGVEAASLKASIAGTDWSAAIDKSHRAGLTCVYTVAQNNDPFEFGNRVNELWFLFAMENEQHAM